MFFSLRILKNLNLSKKSYIYIYKRSQNISLYYFKKKRIYISRGLYPVKFYGGKQLQKTKYKFGAFSFTRKPFAIPESKNLRKR
jgi:hypothetical protein